MYVLSKVKILVVGGNYVWTNLIETRIDTSVPVLQPLRWRCVECVIHHERDVRDE